MPTKRSRSPAKKKSKRSSSPTKRKSKRSSSPAKKKIKRPRSPPKKKKQRKEKKRSLSLIQKIPTIAQHNVMDMLSTHDLRALGLSERKRSTQSKQDLLFRKARLQGCWKPLLMLIKHLADGYIHYIDDPDDSHFVSEIRIKCGRYKTTLDILAEDNIRVDGKDWDSTPKALAIHLCKKILQHTCTTIRIEPCHDVERKINVNIPHVMSALFSKKSYEDNIFKLYASLYQ